jgi:hypothetical protein
MLPIDLTCYTSSRFFEFATDNGISLLCEVFLADDTARLASGSKPVKLLSHIEPSDNVTIISLFPPTRLLAVIMIGCPLKL